MQRETPGESASSGLALTVDIPFPTRRKSSTLLRTPIYLLSGNPSGATLLPTPTPKFLRPSIHLSSPNTRRIHYSTYRPTCYDSQFILPRGIPRYRSGFPTPRATIQRARFLFK